MMGTGDGPSGHDAVTFPPIPLATGNSFVDDNGVTHVVEKVVITVIAGDGTTKEVELESRLGAWWAPTPH